MKILITGICGFVGSHLAEAYLKQGDEVFGTYKTNCLANELENIEEVKDKIKLFDCDLRDRGSVFRVLNEVKPDTIHHLAAQSFVKSSWDNPEFTITNNIISELNVFEVCRQLNINPVIHIAGSSEEYGKQEKIPITEEMLLKPMSPYAVSKVGQDMLAQQYFISYGLKTVITRAFNHEGPRRGIQFVTSAFASQAVDIFKRIKEPIFLVGNLDAIRDYTDIDDMVRAYMLAVKFCEYGKPYNIASGEGHKINEILNYYINKYLIDIDGIRIEKDFRRMRPSDLPVLIGDSTKFRRITGWKPVIDFKEMLDKIFKYWYTKK